MKDLVELYCKVDDSYKTCKVEMESYQLGACKSQKNSCRLSASEVMTLLIYFHQMRFRDFKTYYLHYVQGHLEKAFPGLLSYNRFIELIPSVLVPFCCFVHRQSGIQTGVYFIDSTHIPVCHIRRAASNKVFKRLARKGKSSVGWVYGFKLHLVINDQGQIMAFRLSHANTDDRFTVESMTRKLQGKLIADKGYLSQKLSDSLYSRGLQLITKIKKNMKNKLMPLIDRLLLRKRSLIETVYDQLKNLFHLQHTRHRSPINCLVNLFAALAAYSLQPSKPSCSLNNLLLSS